MLTLLLVAGSVGLDNFAAAIAVGLAGIDRAVRIRVAVVFGVFEAGMPVIGLLAGSGVAGVLHGESRLIGGGLLIVVGLHTLIEALRRGGGERPATLAGAPLGRLVLLAVGLSIDNLIVGFALGARQVSLVEAVVTIGVFSVALSLLGLEIGGRLGEEAEERSELLGGVVLTAVGAAVLSGVI